MAERKLSYRIINADVLKGLKTIKDSSIDCIVTSPPYYGQRNYEIEGQIGLEHSPQLYVDKMTKVFEELFRVLKETGTFFLNIGDSYSGHMGKRLGWSFMSNISSEKDGTAIKLKAKYDLPKKCLLCIPERLMFACLEIGFILRNKIIWLKIPPLCQSVKDRFSNVYEFIYFFSKSQRYFFDLEAVKEPYSEKTIERLEGFIRRKEKFDPKKHKTFSGQHGMKIMKHLIEKKKTKKEQGQHINGWVPLDRLDLENLKKNPGDVWLMQTAQFPKDFYKGKTHFAVFPEELPKMCILSGSPEFGTVLDPFLGSGTTLKVAKQLLRSGVGIDIKKDYLEMAKKRIVWNEQKIGIETEYIYEELI